MQFDKSFIFRNILYYWIEDDINDSPNPVIRIGYFAGGSRIYNNPAILKAVRIDHIYYDPKKGFTMKYMKPEYLNKVFNEANATPVERTMVVNLNQVLSGEDSYGIRISVSIAEQIAAATALLQIVPALERRAAEKQQATMPTSAHSDLAEISEVISEIDSHDPNKFAEKRFLTFLENSDFDIDQKRLILKGLNYYMDRYGNGSKAKMGILIFSSVINIYRYICRIFDISSSDVFDNIFGLESDECGHYVDEEAADTAADTAAAICAKAEKFLKDLDDAERCFEDNTAEEEG